MTNRSRRNGVREDRWHSESNTGTVHASSFSVLPPPLGFGEARRSASREGGGSCSGSGVRFEVRGFEVRVPGSRSPFKSATRHPVAMTPAITHRAAWGQVCLKRFQPHASTTIRAITASATGSVCRGPSVSPKRCTRPVPHRAVDDAEVDEVDEEGFLRNGAEDVRQPHDAPAQVRDDAEDERERRRSGA